MDSVTVLHARPNKRATKQFTFVPETRTWGPAQDYDDAGTFRFTIHPAANVYDIGKLIDRFRSDRTAMIVRGKPIGAALDPKAWLRRKLGGPSTPGTLEDRPTHMLMTDVDKFPCTLLELIDDPEAVVRRAIETMLPAEFQNVSCFYQYSSSAGFRDSYAGIHLWWWLTTAYDSRTVKRWLKPHAARSQLGKCKVDLSILSGNIPHYIANPVTIGGHDPLPCRTGFIIGENDAIDLGYVDPAPPRHEINLEWTGPAQRRRAYEKLKSALEFIPNDEDVEREHWIAIGYNIKAALGEDGLDLWLAWSQSGARSGKSGKSDTAETKWAGFNPTQATGGTIYYLARQAGWSWDDDAVPLNHGLPAYYPAPTEPRDEAIKRQNGAIRSAITTGAERAVLRRAIAAKRQEAIENCEDWEILSRAEKAKISRAARREALAEAGVTRVPPAVRRLVTGAQGTGKTATAAETCAAIRGDVVVRALQPSLAKAEEFAAAYNEIAGPDSLPAVVIRGRSAKESDDQFMCHRVNVVRAAIDKGVNVRKSICSKCPLQPIPPMQSGCGYLRQEARLEAMGERGLFVGSNQYLRLPMPGPKPDILVVDEDVTLASAEVIEIPPAQLEHIPYRGGDNLGEIIEADQTIDHVKAALLASEPLVELRMRGIDAEAIRKARRLGDAAMVETDPGITGDMSDAEILRKLEEVPTDNLGRTLILLSAVAREIDLPRRTMTGVVFHPDREVTVDGKVERQPRFRVHRLIRSAGVTAQTTVLVMDGTGSASLNKAVFGQLEHVHTPVERDAHVTGTVGKVYSRQSHTGLNRHGETMSGKKDTEAKQLRRDLVRIAARLPGRVMFASTKGAVDVIKTEGIMPAHVEPLAHFGKIRGLNAWEDCDSALISGQQSVSVGAVEDIARAFCVADPVPFISAAVPIPADWHRTGWPYVAILGRRMRDGRVEPVEVEIHPDPRCQEVLEQIREAEVIQAADRIRPVFNRRTLVLANNLVLPLTYDRVLSHAELVEGGSRLEQAFLATGILPLGATDLHRLHPTIFPTRKAAQHALERRSRKAPQVPNEYYLEFGGPFSYRIAGGRGSLTRALIDPRRHPAPRAALEAALGQLSFFQADNVAEPPPSGDDRHAGSQAPPPEPPAPRPEEEQWSAAETPPAENESPPEQPPDSEPIQASVSNPEFLGALKEGDATPQPDREFPGALKEGREPQAPMPLICDVPWLHADAPAFRAEDGAVVVPVCPFCGERHRHRGFGHRLAHCADPGGRGYVLRPVVGPIPPGSGAGWPLGP